MNNWYTCVNGLPVIFGVSAKHRGFHGRTLRTALPPLHPRTVGILEACLLSPKSLSIKALLQWSFIVVIACDNQANCSNTAGNDRHVCMDYVSCICAKFYTCINKTSVKCALYPGHWQINLSIIFLISYYGTHYLPYFILNDPERSCMRETRLKCCILGLQWWKETAVDWNSSRIFTKKAFYRYLLSLLIVFWIKTPKTVFSTQKSGGCWKKVRYSWH